MGFERIYAHIIERYPKYVTQKQLCDICGICPKTAYNLERSGRIPYTVEVNRLVKTHRIKLTDILLYLYEKECRQESDSPFIVEMRRFYSKQLRCYPDLLTVSMVCSMTGFSKSGVGYWVKKGKLKSMLIKKGYKIPKPYLIDFLVSPYYRQIRNKSEKQKTDMAAFNEAFKAHLAGVGS